MCGVLARKTLCPAVLVQEQVLDSTAGPRRSVSSSLTWKFSILDLYRSNSAFRIDFQVSSIPRESAPLAFSQSLARCRPLVGALTSQLVTLLNFSLFYFIQLVMDEDTLDKRYCTPNVLSRIKWQLTPQAPLPQTTYRYFIQVRARYRTYRKTLHGSDQRVSYGIDPISSSVASFIVRMSQEKLLTNGANCPYAIPQRHVKSGYRIAVDAGTNGLACSRVFGSLQHITF